MKKDGTYRYAYTYYNPGGIYYLPYENLWDNYHWKGKDMKAPKPKKVLLTPEEQYDLERRRREAAEAKKGLDALDAIRNVNPLAPGPEYLLTYYQTDKPRLWTKQEILKVIAEQFPPAPKKRGFWPW